MAWTKVVNKLHGANAGWRQEMCICINGTLITFSDKMMGSYGWKAGDRVNIFVDEDDMKIGFKKSETPREEASSFKIGAKNRSGPNKNGKRAENPALSWGISSSSVRRFFPTARGIYRAKLNQEGIIEVSLLPANRIGTTSNQGQTMAV